MYIQSENPNYTPEVHKGDVFYVRNTGPSVGCEQRAGRPAIIVSNEMNNTYSRIIEIVYLTTKEKHPLPTHVEITQTKRKSTALCEAIYSIDRSRLAEYICTINPDTMKQIDTALAISVGNEDITNTKTFRKAWSKAYNMGNLQNLSKSTIKDTPEYKQLEVERDLYKKMYQDLLAKTKKAEQ